MSEIGILLPCVIAVLIFVTRRIVLCMFIGIVLGGIALHYQEPMELPSYFWHKLLGVFYSFEFQTLKIDMVCLFVFLILLGILSRVLVHSGAMREFEKWAQKNIHTQVKAELSVFMMSLFIFLDGLFSVVVSGQFARSLKRYSSPQRMAYIVDSIASPICVLIPISSWGAYILGLLGQNVRQEELFVDFFEAMTQSFYAWFCPLAVFLVIVWRVDLGAMRTSYTGDKKQQMGEMTGQTNPWGLFAPLLALVCVTLVMMIASGVSAGGVGIWGILSKADVFLALVCGVVVALLLALLSWKNITLSGLWASVREGGAEMFSLLGILILLWMFGSLLREDLQSGFYLSQFLISFLSAEYWFLIPAGLFLVSALIAFLTGTGWGTLAIMIPLSLDWGIHLPFEVGLLLACVISGAVYGDHSSPVSDTTILSASSLDCSLQSHFITQIPYTTLVACCTLISFVVMGIKGSLLLAFLAGGVCLFGFLAFFKGKKRRI
ncbi:hypothetical protein BBW65_01700 [Helicobacter enhydrae]|uniref:Na+/H+ antiporter NhaC-like C-terminal domain-containing protein n=1 Tax=Helicobacter enhydrae TaxID=222136 RepID=A0A1B1U4C5_9HELI|nr:Na+/H+ antiporter NhaC family protein [Helicobacter enhydrae]ANV97598.1 hypothetical protein BBW65_01700 [Helicobacter enhydrae]